MQLCHQNRTTACAQQVELLVKICPPFSVLWISLESSLQLINLSVCIHIFSAFENLECDQIKENLTLDTLIKESLFSNFIGYHLQKNSKLFLVKFSKVSLQFKGQPTSRCKEFWEQLEKRWGCFPGMHCTILSIFLEAFSNTLLS